MMTREQINERISKKNKDIEKIEKRISKWSEGLRQSDIDVCKPFGDCVYGTCPRNKSWRDFHGTEKFQEAKNNYNAYLESHHDIPESDNWNKGPNIGELYSAYRDLGEARNTLKNYQLELNKLTNYENEEKIKVIWDFLMKWRQDSYNWYLKNCERYFNLKKEYKQAKEDWKSKQEKDSKGRIPYYLESQFDEDYYSYIDSLTKEITKIKFTYVYKDEYHFEYDYVPEAYEVDTSVLNKKLDDEVRAKYTNLVQEITHITGKILDASRLSIGGKGDINGIVLGENGKAKVLTFEAGLEWIVQRPHYRTKVSRVD